MLELRHSQDEECSGSKNVPGLATMDLFSRIHSPNPPIANTSLKEKLTLQTSDLPQQSPFESPRTRRESPCASKQKHDRASAVASIAGGLTVARGLGLHAPGRNRWGEGSPGPNAPGELCRSRFGSDVSNGGGRV